MSRRTPSPALVVAVLALVVALSGVAYAAGLGPNTVGTRQLKKNAVTSVKIKNGAVRPRDLRPAAPWQALPFAPGWGNLGGQTPATYRKDQLGRVHLRGLASKLVGTPLNGDLIGTLPVGYRPASGNVRFPVASGGPWGAGVVLVDTGGRVVWYVGGTQEPDAMDLSSISFWIS